MAINLQNKRQVEFNSSSMSDLVFLLLIFFMITSTLVAPNAINITLPKSNSDKQLASRNIEVYSDKENNYYVNPENAKAAPVPYDELLPVLQGLAAEDTAERKFVTLRADKDVTVEHIVALMDVLNLLNEGLSEGQKYKIIMAIEPK